MSIELHHHPDATAPTVTFDEPPDLTPRSATPIQRGYPMPRFEFDDSHYREISDLLFTLRDARLAWRAAKGKVAEWNCFADQIRRGQRTGAAVRTMIAEAESCASGWRRRANARTHRPGEPQNSRNSERGLIL